MITTVIIFEIWQKSKKKTKALFQELYKESDVQFKMKAWADFSSLVDPLESFVQNVKKLEWDKLINYEAIRRDINVIANLAKTQLRIEQEKVRLMKTFWKCFNRFKPIWDSQIIFSKSNLWKTICPVSLISWERSGDCWDVRQCFVQQLFGFSLTMQE